MMMQLNNKTPFAAQIVLSPDDDGVETLFIVVKASFKMGTSLMLAEEQIAPQAEDEYWAEPGKSSLKYAADFHSGKPSSDIVVLGNAYPPAGGSVRSLDVGVSVGSVHKVLRVFGDRYWDNGFATKPELFESMPLLYEHAFGGLHIVGGKLKSAEQRNPVGRGYKGANSRAAMQGQPLPNIEDPLRLIQDMSDTPEPAGFGFRAPHWFPRANFGGTYDDDWQVRRAPYVPEDYDKRFQQAASPGLIYPSYLTGGEHVKVINMHLKGAINFVLPKINLLARIKIEGEQEQQIPSNIETLILEPNDLRMQIVWKGAYECNNRVPKIQSVDLSLSR